MYTHFNIITRMAAALMGIEAKSSTLAPRLCDGRFSFVRSRTTTITCLFMQADAADKQRWAVMKSPIRSEDCFMTLSNPA